MRAFFLSITVIFLATFRTCHGVDQSSLYPCGELGAPLQVRITHGWDADSKMWPWHAALFRREKDTNEYICGASLIGQSFVVTAAHCVVNKATGHKIKPSLFTVHLGRQHLNETAEWIQEIAVKSVVIHPQFVHEGLKNDIALLGLKTQVQFSEHVLPICLDGLNFKIDDLVGKDGVIAGWGKTESGHVSMTLQTATLPVIDYIACLNSDPQFYSQLISYGMFCAGYENGTSVCNGDSGSGMFFLEGEKWTLRGIVSFSGLKADRISCDFHRYAGFTNVRYYIPWMQRIINDDVALVGALNFSAISNSPTLYTCNYDADNFSDCHLSNIHLVHGSTVNFSANNKMPSLVSIERSYLQFLPKNLIDAFPAMQYLNLENVRIRNIELNAFKTAASLLSINAHLNRLEEVSRNAFSGARSLNQLNLSSNHIEFMDEFVLTPINRLKNLDVSGNRITHLPAFNKNTFLRMVNASHNLINEVSDNHFVDNKQLRTIDVSHNRLTNLDLRQFDACRVLKTIDVNFNQLKRVHIPQYAKHIFANNNSVEHVSAGKCIAETLCLATNRLQSSPDVSNCTSLKLLDLSNNLLQEFSYALIARMHRLENLNLSNNRILIILHQPSNKKFGSTLRILDLSHNLIKYIPSFDAFEWLETVKLNHNELQYLSFNRMNRLQEAYLSNNQWDCSVLENIRVQSTDRDLDSCKEGFSKPHGICCRVYRYPHANMSVEMTRNDFVSNASVINILCPKPAINRTMETKIRAVFAELSATEKRKHEQQAILNATLKERLYLSKTYDTITALHQSLREKASEMSRIINLQLKSVDTENRDAGWSDLELLHEILKSMAATVMSTSNVLEHTRQHIARLPHRERELTMAIRQAKHDIRTINQDLKMLEHEERHLKVQQDGMERIIQHRNNIPNRHGDAFSTHQVNPSVGGYSVSHVGGYNGPQSGGFYSEHSYHYEHHSTNIG